LVRMMVGGSEDKVNVGDGVIWGGEGKEEEEV
jgi:hypothetical protein